MSTILFYLFSFSVDSGVHEHLKDDSEMDHLTLYFISFSKSGCALFHFLSFRSLIIVFVNYFLPDKRTYRMGEHQRFEGIESTN